MSFLKNLFGGNKDEESKEILAQKQQELHDQLKQTGLENILGTMHDRVMHAVIPFEVGGAVDLYYFLNHIEGTGIATMELITLGDKKSLPNKLGSYELVAFTKEKYNQDDENPNQFNEMENRIFGMFSIVGHYSFQAVLNPKDTCEFEEGSYLIFDNYEPENKKFKIGEEEHHLLLCMEIFASEMRFARENGGETLLNMLKLAGHYPYSDMNRLPII